MNVAAKVAAVVCSFFLVRWLASKLTRRPEIAAEGAPIKLTVPEHESEAQALTEAAQRDE